MQRSVPLAAIQVFVVCARLQSFKQAAEQLYVTPGAVSRQIQALEQYLGVALFERRHRKVSLTAQGENYLQQVAPALAMIDAASAELKQQRHLKLEAMPTFAMHWLIPKLAEFRQQHPDIQVELTTSSDAIQASPQSQSLFIRRDPAQFAGLTAEPFMRERSVLVAAPQLLAQLVDCSAVLLLKQPLLEMRSRPDLWPIWCQAQQLNFSVATQRLLLDNTILAIQAAVEGLGLLLVPEVFIIDQLQQGRLAMLPGPSSLQTGSYSLLRGNGIAADDSTVQAFSDWLHQAASNDISVPG